MKKLIVAAIAIAMAVVVNAAQYNWSTAYEVADGGAGITSATVAYLIDSAVLSQSEIYDAVMGGATLAAAVEGKSLNSSTMTDGIISKKTKVDLPASYVAGNKMTAYMVLFDSDLEALYFSEEITKTLNVSAAQPYAFQNDSSMDAAMADMTGFDKTYGGWVQTAAVPEPTSGLLMLLGMAGLALRRRRA